MQLQPGSLHKCRTGLVLLASLLSGVALSPPVVAEPLWRGGDVRHAGGGRLTGNAFDLHIARENLRLDFDGERADPLEMTIFGIGFHELLADQVRGSLRLGHVEASQSDRAPLQDLDPDGYHAEVDVDGIWPDHRRVTFGYGARWRYTNIRDEDIRLTWHTWELRGGLRARMTNRLGLRLGASVIEVDGKERLRADEERQTTDLTAASRYGAYFQLDFRSGRDGVIRFRGRGGNPAEVMLVFEQRY